MSTRNMGHAGHGSIVRILTIVMIVLTVVGCGKSEPTAKPLTPEVTGTPIPVATAVLPQSTEPPATPEPLLHTPAPATQQASPLPLATETGALSASVTDVVAGLEGLPIDTFFEESFLQLQLRDPEGLIYNGLGDECGIGNDQFTDRSDAYVRETQQLESAILDLLRTYDREALSPDQQLSYDIYEWYLDDLVRGHTFIYYDYPINSMSIWDAQNALIDFMVNYHPVTSRKDAEDYITRLSKLDTWTEQLLEGLRLREEAGVVPPRYIIQEARQQVQGHLQVWAAGAPHPEEIVLYTSFQEKLGQLGTLSAEEKESLLDAALAEIEGTFVPAFQALSDHLAYLGTVATDDAGAWKFPQGAAYYAHALRSETTTDLTPDGVYEIGLAEVARIQAEMRTVAAELGYPEDISMVELSGHLWEDSAYLEGEALVAEYERLIAEIDEASEAAFDLRPRMGVTVEREPFGATVAYYRLPALDGSRPGRFFVNLDYATARYRMPTLTYHETIPGHHLQIALARELDLPTFRKALVFNAYAEGWALYAEQLAWEMGMYEEDPLGNLGRLQYELLRAARLVVDTGIHDRGWTWQEGAAYFEEAMGWPHSQEHMVRYIILPGQASGYKLGMIKILELRQRAMDALGERFDLKEFHNVILGQGSMPLEILERVVDDWIEASTAATTSPLSTISIDTVNQVERLSTLSGYHDKVNDLAFSGDGAYLASSSLDETIKLWSVVGWQEVHAFRMNKAGFNGIALSADGRLLACADAIWDVESGQAVHMLEQGRNDPGPVAFSPDGSLLAVALEGRLIKLWDVASGDVLRTFKERPDDVTFSVAFSPDGALLAAGVHGGMVRLWDVERGQVAGTLDHGGPSDDVHDLAFSPDGELLASAGNDDTVHLWDVASRQAVHILRHGNGLYGVAFSPDGRLVASACCDRTVKLWDVESGRMLRSLPHNDEVMAVAFSPDGTLLASAGYDHQICLWGIPRRAPGLFQSDGG